MEATMSLIYALTFLAHESPSQDSRFGSPVLFAETQHENPKFRLREQQSDADPTEQAACLPVSMRTSKPEGAEPKVEGFWKQLGRAALADLRSRVQLGPGLDHLGIHVRPIKMSITNCTPFFVKVFAYGKTIALLVPGDEAFDNRHFESLETQVPLAALFYSDSSRKQYLGAAGQVLSIIPDNPVSFFWIMGEGDVQSAKNVGYRNKNPLARRTTQKNRQVKFPREWLGGTAGVQIVNNTPYTAHVLINSKRRSRLISGGLDYLSVQGSDTGRAEVLNLQFRFAENEKYIGMTERQISIPPNGVVQTQQLILTPDDVRM